MRRWLFGLALACGSSALWMQGASAQNVPPPAPGQIQIQVQVQNGQQIQVQIQNGQVVAKRAVMLPRYNTARLVPADAVVVGRVIGLEPMDVEATPAAGQTNKINYRIAVVQINEVLHGLKKDAKMVRVGFIAQPMNGNVGGGGGVIGGGIQIQPALPPGAQLIRRGGYIGMTNLQVGQDGLFLLNKHHKEKFYLLPNYNSFVSSQNNPNFETEVKTTKQLYKVMGDTTAALKSDDAQQRYLAAAVLISKYRSNTTGLAMKQEPIDAAESKLILKALAGGDWTPNRFNATVPGAMEMFNMLGLTAADGYQLVNVRNQQDITQAMQKWLSENTGKYRIKKLVADPNAKVQPGVRPGIRPLPAVQPGGIQPAQPVPQLKRD